MTWELQIKFQFGHQADIINGLPWLFIISPKGIADKQTAGQLNIHQISFQSHSLF